MSIIFRCAVSLHTVFLFLVFIYNLKVTLGQICFAYYKLSSRIGRSDTLPAVLKIYFDEIIRFVGNAYA